MKLIRNSFAAGIAFAALAVAACSSQHGATGTGSSSNGNDSVGNITGTAGDLGSVGMHLDIGGGAQVTALNWSISDGTPAHTYTGTNTIGDAQSFEFVQGGIVAGGGYTVTLTGTDTKGDPCTGKSSTFTIVAGQVTQTTLAVICTVPTDASTAADVGTGSVEVDASVSLVNAGAVACPGISSFSISPAELTPGQPAALTLVSTGPASVLTWSVSPAGGGSFGSTSALNTTFQCAAPTSLGFQPQVTVTATLALPDSGACTGQTFTTMSALVNCEGIAVPPRCTNPALPTDCTPSATSPTCVNTQTDVNNCGGCGTVCASGDTCVAGVCTIPAPVCAASCPASDTVNCGNGPITGIGSPGCNQTETILNNHAKTCLECALNNFCLHDNQGDTPATGAIDCEDVSGNDTSNPSVTNTQTCLNLLTCELTSKCGKGGVLDCYCGVGVNSTTCKTTQSGSCISQTTAGLDSTDPNFIELNMTATAKGNGGSVASKIDNCLFQNCQASCF